MKKQFGKGKQAHVFHSIVNSNDLQLVSGPVIAVPDSLFNSRGQSVSMRVHNDSSSFFHMRGLSFIGEERAN